MCVECLLSSRFLLGQLTDVVPAGLRDSICDTAQPLTPRWWVAIAWPAIRRAVSVSLPLQGSGTLWPASGTIFDASAGPQTWTYASGGSPSSPTSALEAGSRNMVESGVDRTQADSFCFSSSRAVFATHFYQPIDGQHPMSD